MRTRLVDITDSTNSLARAEVLGADARDPFAIITRCQTAGRGRLGRPWLTPPGASIFTVAWPAPPRPEASEAIPLHAALAMLQAVADAAPASAVDLKIKWPNDLLFRDAKLGGVLCERVESGRGAWVLIGVGINAAVDQADLADLDQPAATLAAITPDPVNPIDLARAVINGLDHRLVGDTSRLTASDLDALRSALAWVGEPMTIAAPGHEHAGVRGTLLGVDPQGRALVETAAGPVTCHSGEFSLRRAPTRPPAGASGGAAAHAALDTTDARGG